MHHVLPGTADEAVALLREATIPASVLDVGNTLHRAGHQAVLVGGAVRDCLRGVPHADWDLATSATPQEVLDLFPRTIPTGLAHGTVTVLIGRGEHRQVVEVTTFRGDGAYADGRRPDSVRFLRDIEEDLARRDFTINALAWDPFGERFFDRYGGLADLRAGIVRAVGDAAARFREDGLRTMRAVRFCAVMAFALEPATEAAISGALDVFDRVSRERVRVELFKLLSAGHARPGLEPMGRTGLWPRVLTPLDAATQRETIDAVDRLPPDPVLRLARLLWPCRQDPEQIAAALDGLRLSRADRRHAVRLTDPRLAELQTATDGPILRRRVAELGPEHLDHALALLAVSESQRSRIDEVCRNAVLDPKQLAIGARELMAELGVAKGPGLGDLLARLFDYVLADPRHNESERLIEHARELIGRSP